MRFSVSFLHHLIDPLLLLLLLLLCSSSVFIVESSCNDFESSRTSEMAAVRLGGIKDSHVSAENSAEVETLARFAVDEHNKKQNAILEFARVVRAREQVVAGKLHHLTLEAIDGGKKKLYEAKVWVKPWLNFTELQEFKDAGDSPSITPSDLGAKRDGHESGWQVVPVNDPEVLNAAHHAIKTIQQRSNSLFPYQLQEVSHAKAEVVDDTAKFNLDLKVMRGNKEERFNVEVHKNSEGNLLLSQMDEHKAAAT